MDDRRFDTVTAAWAVGRPRRCVVRSLLAGTGVAVAASLVDWTRLAGAATSTEDVADRAVGGDAPTRDDLAAGAELTLEILPPDPGHPVLADFRAVWEEAIGAPGWSEAELAAWAGRLDNAVERMRPVPLPPFIPILLEILRRREERRRQEQERLRDVELEALRESILDWLGCMARCKVLYAGAVASAAGDAFRLTVAQLTWGGCISTCTKRHLK